MENTEYKIAKGLLEIEAVRLSPEKPFLWASGLHSPIYCDNRKALSYPAFRRTICEAMIDVINATFKDVDVIAGVATGAIAYGAIVAEMMGKPFVYIRSKAKDHGMGNQVEGVLRGGERVVVIEDLISTGQSSLAAVDSAECTSPAWWPSSPTTSTVPAAPSRTPTWSCTPCRTTILS